MAGSSISASNARGRAAAVLLLAAAALVPQHAWASDAEDAASEPLRIQEIELPDAAVGQPYSATIVASGGTGVALTWRVVEGALPAGLVIDGRLGAERLWDGEWAPVGANPLAECSGLVASANNPGFLWVHDDASGAPAVYAMREDGTVAHTYRVVGFDNEPSCHGPFAIDIEALIEPDDLQAALNANASARDAWNECSASVRKRALYHIKTAKRPDTRARRIAQIVERVAAGDPPA